MTGCPMPHDQPAETDGAMVICRYHRDHLRHSLADLAEILAVLDDLLLGKVVINDDANDRRAARTDAPAPCRLDVLDLTDKRSDTPALYHLAFWCAAVAEERELSGFPEIPAEQATWLIRHLDWISHHPAADEIVGDLEKAWRWVRVVAGYGPLPPIMECPVVYPETEEPCGGPVYPSKTHFAVTCLRCGETWDGDAEMRRLGLIAERPKHSDPTV